jgi:hypothetical protein
MLLKFINKILSQRPEVWEKSVIQIDKTRYPPQPPPVLINELDVAIRFNLGFI